MAPSASALSRTGLERTQTHIFHKDPSPLYDLSSTVKWLRCLPMFGRSYSKHCSLVKQWSKGLKLRKWSLSRNSTDYTWHLLLGLVGHTIFSSEEKDEHIYHERLVHVPLLLCPKPRRAACRDKRIRKDTKGVNRLMESQIKKIFQDCGVKVWWFYFPQQRISPSWVLQICKVSLGLLYCREMRAEEGPAPV